VQKQHDVADRFLLGPAGGNLIGAELADAGNLPQLFRIGLCANNDETKTCREFTVEGIG
jgi:hypothetical protein